MKLSTPTSDVSASKPGTTSCQAVAGSEFNRMVCWFKKKRNWCRSPFLSASHSLLMPSTGSMDIL